MSDAWDRLWRRPERAPPPDNVTPLRTEGAHRYAVAALESECSRLASTPTGERNDALNRAAYRMGRHIAAGTIGAGDVLSALTIAGRACGLDDAEIAKVLRDTPDSAINQARANPRQPSHIEPVPEPSVLDVAADELQRSSLIREKFPLLDWRALWDDDTTEEWVLEPLLPARRLVALFSPPKVGKSLLMLEVAVGVAQGSTVLGTTPDRARRVLYVDFENDPRGDVRERLKAMGQTPEQLDNLCYLSYPTLAKLDTVAGASELMAVVAEYECEVVVIDTISRAVAGEENENDTWLAFYRNTGLAMKQMGVSCIRLDHTGKDAEKGMRGGSAKYGDVDAVWKLTKITEETYQLDCTDHRLPIAEKTLVVKRRLVPSLHHEVQAEGRMASWRAKIAQIVKALDDMDVPNDVGRDGARDLLQGTGISARNDVLSAAVRERKLRVGIVTELTDED